MVPSLLEIFSLDCRSLSLMRILLGLFVLQDVADRSRHAFEHYSHLAFWPMTDAFEHVVGTRSVSLFFVGGSAAFQRIAFASMALVALGFMVGYRSRLCSVLLWLFVLSLHNRNPFLLDSGDRLLCCVLFWCMFLPLDRRFSVDRALRLWRRADRRRERSRRRHSSNDNESDDRQHKSESYVGVASVALLVQLFLFYSLSALRKTAPEWQNGSAMYYMLSLDQYATPLGHYVLRAPTLTHCLTFVFRALELAIPLCLLAPLFNAQMRIVACAAAIAFHALFGALLELGTWYVVPPLVAVALLPSRFWTATILRRGSNAELRRISIVCRRRRPDDVNDDDDDDAADSSWALLFYVFRELFVLPNDAKLIEIRDVHDDKDEDSFATTEHRDAAFVVCRDDDDDGSDSSNNNSVVKNDRRTTTRSGLAAIRLLFEFSWLSWLVREVEALFLCFSVFHCDILFY
jgi:hypothetical protein